MTSASSRVILELLPSFALMPRGQAQILKQRRLPRLSHPNGEMAEPTLQPSMSTEEATHRRRGGISPLRVSTPHELKSCPSTSPTHPGIPEQSLRHAIVAIYGWAKGRRWCFRTDCRSCHTSLCEHMAEQTHQPTTATQQAAHRRRGGIEPLRVSTHHMT